MGPFCPHGTSRVGPVRKSSLFGHVKNPLLTTGKLVRLKMAVYWLRFFCVFIDLELGGGGGIFVPPPYKRL